MIENVLVTGGAGFIGSHLVDALLAAGYKVRVFDNLEPQVHGGLRELAEKPDYLNPEADFVLGDIRDLQAVSKALRGIDVVFHQAALVGVGQSMYEVSRYTDINAVGTATLLQAVIDSKERPRKIIVASSMSIYGEGAYICPAHGAVCPNLRPVEQLEHHEWEMRCPVPGCHEHASPIPTSESKPLAPTSIYAINKRDHEEMSLAIGWAYHIPAVALRYFNVYGTRQALSNPYTGVAAIFSSRLLNHKTPIIYEDGLQRRDFTHVSDIVQANLIAMQQPQADYGIFNVGTGRALTILEMAAALSRHMGLEIEPEVVQKFRAGDIRHCYADISRLSALGYQPKVRFEDGVAELVNWVSRQQAVDGFEKARRELKEKGLV
jgi:dTDP-L-rhamnose 4-epimerase